MERRMERKHVKGGRLRLAAGIILAAVMTAAGAAGALAQERQKIDEIHLTVESSIQSGSSSGNVRVTSGDDRFRVSGAEILNDDDEWIGGMTPRVSVELYARSGYYFSGTSKSMFTLSGDDARVTAVRREDDQTTLIVTLKLDKLENGDLTVTGAEWDEGSGTASWDENPNARYYQVRLYRDDKSLTGSRTAYDTSYEFGGYITKRGDYYFEVRAVGSGSEKGDWESSDTWYVSAREADDISYGYETSPGSSQGSYGPGGWTPAEGHGHSGGPGVSQGGSGSGGPGVSSGSSGSGGPGVQQGISTSTSSGNHWCLDQSGWWFQFADGSWPRDCWRQIDGKWYCFGQNGYIRCGWIEWSGRWYYTEASGAMLVNAKTPDGYYVGGDGAWIP
ncbi:MAG: hypothetical protein Q4C73_06700 [Eubacteriales bacterium]|nr:hypothetical protein [Eubacteriales bacterium]